MWRSLVAYLNNSLFHIYGELGATEIT